MKHIRMIAAACAVSVLSLNAAMAQPAQTATPPAATFEPRSGQAGKDVVWVPTPQALVDRMLDMAGVTKDDYLVDLGSGDGRTVITAAKRGVRALGIEFNPDLVILSQRAAEAEGVSATARFQQGDIFESDFSDATVVTLFLLTELNVRLRPTLLDMKPGTRVVSNTFTMGDWTPDQTITAGEGCTSYCQAHKWIIPAKVAGTWRLPDGELRLTQNYQTLSGTLSASGKTVSISDARMNGAEITFTAGGKRYSGRVGDGRIDGNSQGAGGDQAWSATRAAT